jgi:peptide/nickel transport system permease protein
MYADYILRRFGIMLLVVFFAVTINFMLPRLMPGDPIEAQLTQLLASGAGSGDITAMVESYRARFGLDQPIFNQYIAYWQSLFRLDLGVSLAAYPERVIDAIAAGLPWTLGLLGFATLVSFLVGSLLGGLMGWPRSPRFIRRLGAGVVILSAVPYFLVGMILLYVFAIRHEHGLECRDILGHCRARHPSRHFNHQRRARRLGARHAWHAGQRAGRRLYHSRRS